MHHHHISQQGQAGTLRQIYEKQKTDYTKGEWFQLLLKDFEFIGETMSGENIQKMSKLQYKKNINDLIKKRLSFNIFPNKKMDIKKLKTWFIMS